MENDHSVKHLDPEQTQHFFCLLRKKEMKERKETEVLEGTHFELKNVNLFLSLCLLVLSADNNPRSGLTKHRA